MSEKLIDLIAGVTMPLTGATVPFKMQNKQAADAPPPNTTKGTLKGDTPYRQAILDLMSSAGTVQMLTIQRPSEDNAGVGVLAQYAQGIYVDGTGNAVVTKFDFAAFDDEYNWLVELNGVVCEYNAAPGPNIDPEAGPIQFSVADDGNGKLEVTIGDGTTNPKGKVGVWDTTQLKRTILSDAANENINKIVNPNDYVMLIGDAWQGDRATLQPYYR